MGGLCKPGSFRTQLPGSRSSFPGDGSRLPALCPAASRLMPAMGRALMANLLLMLDEPSMGLATILR